MQPFDANDYRRRVLAAVHARGSADDSDPFEIYDIPLDEVDRLSDSQVAARVHEVWAFWQKSRDHPRYRGVVLSLLAVHEQTSAVLATKPSRLDLRDRVRAGRDARDRDRFTEIDAAANRLVQRFGGLPEDKIAGLRALAAARGLDDAAFEGRIRRFRRLPAGAAERSSRRTVPADVLRQIRADLDELGRITGNPAPRSLFGLLGIDPGTPLARIRAVRDELAARNRQRRPDRRRALVDDLLAAVTSLLVDGDQEAYLDALALTVTDLLRPKVATAVLVEDELTAADAATLVAEAQTEGLDPARARAVVAALAQEHGVVAPRDAATVPSRPAQTQTPTPMPAPAPRPTPTPAPRPAPPRPRPVSAAEWQAALSRARAALRAGRPIEAGGEVRRSREIAGETLPPIRAVSDDVDRATADAGAAWRVLVGLLPARRYAEAVRIAETLARTASDVPGPDRRTVAAVLAECREQIAKADALLAQAATARGAERDELLAQALVLVVDHAGAAEVVQQAGIDPPSAVNAALESGSVLVSWQASATGGELRYRVRRVLADGTARTVGVTGNLSLEDGGVPAEGPLPAYEVSAGRSGAWSAPARWSPAEVRPDPVEAPDVTRVLPRSAADQLAPASESRVVGDRLQWTWPGGCTEMMVVWRSDAPPVAADDPAGQGQKVTNTRYEINGGVPVPGVRPLHVALFGCVRVDGALVVASSAAPSARLLLRPE